MASNSFSPRTRLRECRFRVGRHVESLRYVCTVHSHRRVSLHIPEEHALELSASGLVGDSTVKIACRVELEKRDDSGWWNLPLGTVVYEKSPLFQKFTETRNCYLAMWLPQLLMRDFLRNEAAILDDA